MITEVFWVGLKIYENLLGFFSFLDGGLPVRRKLNFHGVDSVVLYTELLFSIRDI